MEHSIGPYHKHRIVLCSADAHPHSQCDTPCEAGYFFPGAKWVGTLRNVAERLGCRFVILTTAYGMVDPEEVIEPYDLHVLGHETQVAKELEQTVPLRIGGKRYDIVVFYSGGCPRDPCIELLQPILRRNHIALVTFGRPNMFDIDKTELIVQLLIRGTFYSEIKSALKCPERFEFFPV